MSAVKICLLTGLLLAGICLVYLYNPAQSHIFPPCVFHKLTGLYCPGCGSTRAIHHLLHGSFTGALAMNPLMVLMLPVLVLLCLRKKWAFRPWVAWCALTVLLCYGVLRNINAWPFFFLAPN